MKKCTINWSAIFSFLFEPNVSSLFVLNLLFVFAFKFSWVQCPNFIVFSDFLHFLLIFFIIKNSIRKHQLEHLADVSFEISDVVADQVKLLLLHIQFFQLSHEFLSALLTVFGFTKAILNEVDYLLLHLFTRLIPILRIMTFAFKVWEIILPDSLWLLRSCWVHVSSCSCSPFCNRIQVWVCNKVPVIFTGLWEGTISFICTLHYALDTRFM